MLKLIEKDILTVEKGIIAHQVNTLGLMGSGIALAIRNKWPQVFTQYSSFFRSYSNFPDSAQLLLGKMQLAAVDENMQIFVANIFGQSECGSGDKCYTEYGAVDFAFSELAVKATDYGLQVYVPFRMGCDLAGGDWTTYSAIIEKWIPDAIVCKLPGLKD
jgi:hypothetical protein